MLLNHRPPSSCRIDRVGPFPLYLSMASATIPPASPKFHSSSPTYSKVMPSQTKILSVSVESTRIVKPRYAGNLPPTTTHIPLSVFDKVTYDMHIAIIYAFRAPSLSNSAMRNGLAKVLSEYREFAGRLGEDSGGNPVVLLNDEGVRLVEASVDSTLDQALPFKPSPLLLNLHPEVHGVAELLQVQLTRFACGSLVVGMTSHHRVADVHATSNFLIAWSLATRGLDFSPAVHDRCAFFTPRMPPLLEFEHRGVEFAAKNQSGASKPHPLKDSIVVHKAHFTKVFLTNLKARASSGASKPYSTFESLMAHLWRVVTKARKLHESETTSLRISVDGRRRMMPCAPDEYFGNLVLWAYPRAKVRELVESPLQYAAKLIHDAVGRVNDAYFRSFIDFASSGVVEEENLETAADADKMVLCPNVDVDSWLRLPFYDLDFGGGSPFYFMPSFLAMEGLIFLLPSFTGDGSIEAYVALFDHNQASFKQICYSIE